MRWEREYALRVERNDLQRMRWRLLNNRIDADSMVAPAAVDWLNIKIAEIEKALGGIGAA